jgi:spermidine synthase
VNASAKAVSQRRLAPGLALVMAGLGCFATAAQVDYIREFLVIFAGNELCLGVILACWFAGIVAGALAGGRLAQRVLHPAAWFVSCCISMLVFLPGLVALLRTWRALTGIGAGEVPGLSGLLMGGLVLISPFALLIGLAFPLVCRLAADTDDSRAIGRVYVFESAGAIAGGFAVGVLLAGQVTTLESICITGLPLSAGLIWFGRREARIPALATGVLFITACLALMSGALGSLDASLSLLRFDELGSGNRRIGWADTPYQYLDLGQSGEQYTLFADGKVTRTFPDPYRSRPRAHLVMNEHPRPSRVLLLGSASFEFLPPALMYPVERLDLVEIDPAVNGLVEPVLDPAIRKAFRDPRLHLHLTDGRRFLRRADEVWDVIFADVPDPTTAARNRFFTHEFFELVRSRLAPGGVFVTRLSSSANYLGRETASLVRTVQATLAKVFAQVEVLPGQESFFLACQTAGVLLADPDRLGDRYQARGINDPNFTRYHFKVLFQSNMVSDLQEQITERGAAFGNSDARPVTYLQSVARWAHLMGETSASWLAKAVRLPAWVWYIAVLIIAAMFSVRILAGRADRSVRTQRAVSFSLLVVGAYGMTVELVLTFAYQSMLGSLYREMGLIVACFMAGLAAGSYVMERRLVHRPGSVTLLAKLLFTLAAFSAAVPLLLTSEILVLMPLWVEQVYILFLILAAGIGAGTIFPLTGHIAVRTGRRVGLAAGLLDAADHLGAAAGAFLAGVLLFPVLGRLHTCLLLTLLCAAAGFLNVMLTRRTD